jgi:DNA-binding CsgD family transcriptional regulator
MLERTLARTGTDDPANTARLTARLAAELYWGQGLERGRELAAEAVRIARSLNDQHTLATTLAAHQFVLRGPDNLADRIRIGQELVELARRLHCEALELHGRRGLVEDLLRCDRVAADDQLGQLAALATESDLPLARWYTMLFWAVRATMAGRLNDAHSLVDQAEALGHQLEAQPAGLYAAAQRFVLLRHAGRIADAETTARDSAARWPAMLMWQCVLTSLLADTGRAEEATALLDELLPAARPALPRDSLWMAGLCMLAGAAARLGHTNHAAGTYQALAPYAGRIAAAGVVAWFGAVDHYLALTTTTLRLWDEAEARFKAALALHQAWGATPFVTATLSGYAEMLRRRDHPGDRQQAARLIPAQTRSIDSVSSGSAPLTDREQQVLRLLAEGASNKEIARQFSLSVHTVERHIANIYSKIGVRNRAEATAYALNIAR